MDKSEPLPRPRSESEFLEEYRNSGNSALYIIAIALFLTISFLLCVLFSAEEIEKEEELEAEKKAEAIYVVNEESVRLRVGDKEAMVSIVPDHLGKESIFVEWELDSERTFVTVVLGKLKGGLQELEE